MKNSLLSVLGVLLLLVMAFLIARDEFVYARKLSGTDTRAEGVVESAERTSSILRVVDCRVRVLFQDGGTPHRIEYSKRLWTTKATGGITGEMVCYRLAGTKLTLAYERARPGGAIALRSGFETKSWIFIALLFVGGAVFGVFHLLRGRKA